MRVVRCVMADSDASALRSNTRLALTPLKLPIAIGAVWIFWGSTYAGMRMADETIPPLTMVCIRFLIAGAVLWIACDATGQPRPRRKDWTAAVVSGAMLLMLGNGTTAWALRFIPTGITSLLLSLTPVWMALFDFLLYGSRISRMAMVGIALGFGGIALLVAPSLLQRGGIGSLPILWLCLAVLSNISWSVGSILQRRLGGAASLVRATAMQMLVGGLLVGVESLLFGQLQHTHWAAISLRSIFGLAWLIVFGSFVGYLAFLYVIRNAPTALASTYSYVNPLVAIALGIAIFHERLTINEIVAGAFILAGVALMMVPRQRAAT